MSNHTGIFKQENKEDALLNLAAAAFERSDGAFGLGMFGRLDRGLDKAYGKAVFEAFLQACRSFDEMRRQQEGWGSMRDELCSRISTLVTQGQPLI